MALVVRITTVMLLLVATVKAQLPVIGADSLSKHYQWKMNRFLDRDTALGDFYSIDLNGVCIYADAVAKKNNRPEYRVTWQELPVYKNMMASLPREEAMQVMKNKGSGPFSPSIQRLYGSPMNPSGAAPVMGKPLNGHRIALDPGHFASDSMGALLEDKYIDMKTGPDSARAYFYESQLTWETARLLQQKLEAAGATVLVTRKAYGLTAFGKTFAQWKAEDYPRTLDSLLRIYPQDVNLKKLRSGKLKDNKSIFRYVFRDVELRKRADLINAFHPDLTIIIHFNVDEQNRPWKKTTTKDFCMAFVGGSFQKGELSDPEKRFDFLRLLLLDDIETSTYASGLATASFESTLEVPLAKTGDATYLRSNCIAAGPPGVYCRNLSLTRMVQGTLIYGETLYQDNVYECPKLSSEAGQVSGKAPAADYDESRVGEVAEAYYEAVLNWKNTR